MKLRYFYKIHGVDKYFSEMFCKIFYNSWNMKKTFQHTILDKINFNQQINVLIIQNYEKLRLICKFFKNF